MDNQTNELLHKMQMLRRNECMEIIDSRIFLHDPFIKEIYHKAIELGYDLEIIREIFCNILIDLNFKASNLENANFKQLINSEKFIDLLVIYSSQSEPLNNRQNNSNNKDVNLKKDLNENYEDNEDIYNSNGNNENDLSDDLNDLNGQNLTKIENLKEKMNNISNKLIAKPLSDQQKIQKEQEFLNEHQKRINDPSNLRPIIIDCKDIALSDYSNKQIFLVSRIMKVFDYFEKRNHQIYAILSQSRRDQIMAANTATNQQPKTPDQQILLDLEQSNKVHYTPLRRVGTKRIEGDEDHMKLQLAESKKGIIVSNNNFKKYLNHNEEFKQVIEERVLMYSFIDDTFLPAEDPLGKNGPSLENFLRIEQSLNSNYMKRCPYKKKCTYGAKCKYFHPERGMHQGNQLFKTAHQTVLDQAQENKMRYEIIINKNQPTENNNLQYIQQQQANFNSYSLNNNTHGLVTKKLSVSPPLRYNNNVKNNENIDQNNVKNTKNFGYPTVIGGFKNMSLTNSIKTVNQGPILRAMGPESGPVPNFQITKKNPLQNLLAKEPEIINSDSNLFNTQNFLERYGSSAFNGLEDFSSMSNDIVSNDMLKTQLGLTLKKELAEEVMRKYPQETEVEKLIYLARCLTTSEDDF